MVTDVEFLKKGTLFPFISVLYQAAPRTRGKLTRKIGFLSQWIRGIGL